MQIEQYGIIQLDTEQLNNIIACSLMDDYKRILNGHYPEEYIQYKEAFEKLMEFYLTPNQRKELLTYNVG